ncbi:MAG: FHA domain-containing protein, partial [Deltaproteobacteria bacterium]|nr:FHA domain-containing protein [Deltaproteobacteria bacterium]
MATVTYISDEGVETSYPVGESEPEIHIGRHKSCNIRTSNQSVSRYHARVFFDGQGYYLQDNESVNGTFYENERLKPGEPVPIEDGHYLMCGNFEMRFDFDDDDYNRAQGGEPVYEDAPADDESTRFASAPSEQDDYYPPPPPPPAYAPPPPPPAYAAPPPPPAYAHTPPSPESMPGSFLLNSQDTAKP